MCRLLKGHVLLSTTARGTIGGNDLIFENCCSFPQAFRHKQALAWMAAKTQRLMRPRGLIFRLRATKPLASPSSHGLAAVALQLLQLETRDSDFR